MFRRCVVSGSVFLALFQSCIVTALSLSLCVSLPSLPSLSLCSRSSSASSATSISLPKHLPLSPQIPPHHSSGPALPLSISNLATSHFSLRSQTQHQHHPAMFATPPTLPPPPALPTNSLVIPGHPAGRSLLLPGLSAVHALEGVERGAGWWAGEIPWHRPLSVCWNCGTAHKAGRRPCALPDERL